MHSLGVLGHIFCRWWGLLQLFWGLKVGKYVHDASSEPSAKADNYQFSPTLVCLFRVRNNKTGCGKTNRLRQWRGWKPGGGGHLENSCPPAVWKYILGLCFSANFWNDFPDLSKILTSNATSPYHILDFSFKDSITFRNYCIAFIFPYWFFLSTTWIPWGHHGVRDPTIAKLRMYIGSICPGFGSIPSFTCETPLATSVGWTIPSSLVRSSDPCSQPPSTPLWLEPLLTHLNK